jgi:rhamnose utilization protein RhaD (predicted bifunctional aldolase and dehydrogenase)
MVIADKPMRGCTQREGYDSGHRIATDPVNRRIALGGSLYPDHVVFLGPGVMEWRPDEDFAAMATRWAAAGRDEPPMFLIPGAGVVVRDSLSAGGEEMVRCLALVVERIPDDAPIAYLNDTQVAELLNWDAEKYRQHLASSRG